MKRWMEVDGIGGWLGWLGCYIVWLVVGWVSLLRPGLSRVVPFPVEAEPEGRGQAVRSAQVQM
jgi:hypothetical protein